MNMNTSAEDLEVLNKAGAIGVALGVLACREFLARIGEPAVAELLHRDAVSTLMKNVACGELILQDQVISGQPYDPELDKTFRDIAAEYIRMSTHESTQP